ncbi:MAG TPA: type II toxin-antitoxin system HicB family antitoxin [Candidatus Paceibacterota bacterium]
METRTYKVHLEAEPEGGFTVTVPGLLGCVSYGKDYQEAIAMAQEAIEGFIEALAKAGQPIPRESISDREASTDIFLPVRFPVMA